MMDTIEVTRFYSVDFCSVGFINYTTDLHDDISSLKIKPGNA